jgi:putative transposase
VSESTTEMTGTMIDPVTGEIIDQKELVERLLAQAKEQGVSLVGPGGLLNQLTKNVLETALEAELTEHLGHDHGQTPIAANMRNGTRSKTVLTEIGPVQIEVPFGPGRVLEAGDRAQAQTAPGRDRCDRALPVGPRPDDRGDRGAL